MKRIRSALCALITLAVCFTLCAGSLCSAVSPDEEESASLTVQYSHGETFFDGLEVKIYRIAELHADGTYSLFGNFADYPVSIYGITSQAEWKSITSTLASYALSDGIEPTFVAVTDAEGNASFTDIPHGMYLVAEETVTTESEVFTFESFISVIPRPAEDGSYDYNVVASPKYGFLSWEEDDLELKVVKLWRDTGAESRPDSVKVEILRDGVSEYNVTLSEENSWSYSWTAPNDGAVWTAVERNVPDGYTVTVVKDGGTFLITNTCDTDLPDTPQTNDNTYILTYVCVLSISGVLLIILAVWRFKSGGKRS